MYLFVICELYLWYVKNKKKWSYHATVSEYEDTSKPIVKGLISLLFVTFYLYEQYISSFDFFYIIYIKIWNQNTKVPTEFLDAPLSPSLDWMIGTFQSSSTEWLAKLKQHVSMRFIVFRNTSWEGGVIYQNTMHKDFNSDGIIMIHANLIRTKEKIE